MRGPVLFVRATKDTMFVLGTHRESSAVPLALREFGRREFGRELERGRTRPAERVCGRETRPRTVSAAGVAALLGASRTPDRHRPRALPESVLGRSSCRITHRFHQRVCRGAASFHPKPSRID
jgi:Arc/MetJ family transcription regulator